MRYTFTLFSTVSLLVLCGSSYCQKLCAFSDTDMTKDRAERRTVGIQSPSVEGDSGSHLVLRIRDSNPISTEQVPLIPDNTETLSARENSRPSLTAPSPASSRTMMPKDDVDKEVPQEMQHPPVLTAPEQHLKHQSELSVRMNLDSASQAFLWCRDQGNEASDRELVAHILRDKGWNDLAPEDQEWTVAQVMTIANKLKKVTVIDMPVGRVVAGAAAQKAADASSASTVSYQEEISFEAGVGSEVRGSGWSTPESWGIWTEGPEAVVVLTPPQASTDLALTINGYAFLGGTHLEQEVVVRVNGTLVDTLHYTLESNGPRTIRIPGDIVPTADGKMVVSFGIAHPTSPTDAGVSPDPRKLGISIISLALASVHP